MKKLFALLLVLCSMCGTVVAGADETLDTLEVGRFSFVLPEDYDLSVESPYAETTYVTLTFDETTGEPYEKEIRCGSATVVYRDEWVNIATKYVDELPMEYSFAGTVNRPEWIYGTATSEAEAAFYCQIGPQANWRYSIPVGKLADVGMFNMKPVYFAVYDIGFDASDGTSYYEWRIDMVFYYEGCILTCFMTTDQETQPFELSEAEIEEYFDLLSSLMQCVRPAGMTDDDLTAQKEAAQTIPQDDLIGVWHLEQDIEALAQSVAQGAGVTIEEARKYVSDTSTTITFTDDQTMITTVVIGSTTTVDDFTYELIGNQLVVNGSIVFTLTLDGDQLIQQNPDGIINTYTRLSREYEPVTPITQADIEGVWNVDMKAQYMSMGYPDELASFFASRSSITITFTPDHRILLESTADGKVVQTTENSYELIHNVVVTDNNGRSTLRLNNGVLSMYEGTSMLTMTRAEAGETTTDAPAQPDAQSNGTVPADDTADDTAEAAPTQYVVITNASANIRSGPGGDYAKVATGRKGDTFPLIGEDGGWYIIDVNGKTGYVTKSLSAIK